MVRARGAGRGSDGAEGHVALSSGVGSGRMGTDSAASGSRYSGEENGEAVGEVGELSRDYDEWGRKRGRGRRQARIRLFWRTGRYTIHTSILPYLQPYIHTYRKINLISS